MSNCPYCGIELPGSETTCKKCFEQQYSKLGTPPTTVLQKIAAYIRAPLPMEAGTYRSSLFAKSLCVLGGLFFCWFGAVARTDYKQPLLSAAVFQSAIWCLWMSILYSVIFGRNGLRIYWNVLPFIFCVATYGVAGWYVIGSDAPNKLVDVVFGVGAVVFVVSKLAKRYTAT